MRSRNSASFATPIYAQRDTSSVSWGYFILTVACACVLAAGFFLAAKQHFNTMDYGMKNSSLRKQVEDLQTEQRRLLLAKEFAMSPTEIKRSAKNLGFRNRGEVAVLNVKGKSPTPSSANAEAVSLPARNTETAKPVKAFYPEPAGKADASEKSVKKIVLQMARKAEDSNLAAVGR